jgi:hypothetical protein
MVGAEFINGARIARFATHTRQSFIGCLSALDFVLRFGIEIAGVIAFMKLAAGSPVPS